MFQSEFGLNAGGANELYISASHRLKGEDNLAQQVPNIVKRSQDKVTEEQYVSILSLMNKTGNLEGGLVADQVAMVDAFSNQYDFTRVTNSKWG